jgi:hypothetical protein
LGDRRVLNEQSIGVAVEPFPDNIVLGFALGDHEPRIRLRKQIALEIEVRRVKVSE